METIVANKINKGRQGQAIHHLTVVVVDDVVERKSQPIRLSQEYFLFYYYK